MFSAFDEIDLEDAENGEEKAEDEDLEEDDEDSEKVVVENEYVAEKLSAIFCLEEISRFANPQLIDFYNEAYEELKALSAIVHLDTRKEAFLTIAHLISYLHDYCLANAAQQPKYLESNFLNFTVQFFANILIAQFKPLEKI